MKLLSAVAAGALALSTSASLAAEWTAAYVGGQIGYAEVRPSGGISDGSRSTYGLHIGYDYDFGDWVVGGELDYDRFNIDVGTPIAATVDYVVRGKLRVGYDFGTVLGYAVAGPARVKTTLGSKTDAFYGLGLSFFGSHNWSISGELLYHDFNNIGGSGVNARADTFSLRAAYRF